MWIRSHMQPIAPRCGCDSGVGYDLRKWLVVDAIDFGPWRNAGESVPAAAHSLRDFQRDIVRWRAGSLLTLGFSTALCGMVQVRRRQTSGGRVNPGMATRTGALVSSNSEQSRYGVGSLPIGIRSHRCLHASKFGASGGRD